MPCSSRSWQSSEWMRGSSPLQNAQRGSSAGAGGWPGESASNAAGEVGSCQTRGTSQSAQTVKPWRYSALHWGQNMAQGSLLYAVEKMAWAERGAHLRAVGSGASTIRVDNIGG